MSVTTPKREPNTYGRRRLLTALRAFRRGDFGARLPSGLAGIDGEIAEAFNDCIVFRRFADDAPIYRRML